MMIFLVTLILSASVNVLLTEDAKNCGYLSSYETAQIDHVIANKINVFIHEEMTKLMIPGVSLGVFHNGNIIFAKAYGYSNIEHKVLTNVETLFHSGSIGKQFISMAIMMLVEQDKIKLDEKIGKYLLETPETWNNITVRHLLTHTSGMILYPTDLNFQANYTKDDIYNIIKSVPFVSEPGQQWLYSNSGYILLGFIIEEVAKKPYGDFLTDHIFLPMGMNSTRIVNEADIVMNRASGYMIMQNSLKNQIWVSPIFNTMADGSLYLNVIDMEKWERCLVNNMLLKKNESLDLIWQPTRLNDNRTYPYGLGWSLEEALNGMRIVEHGGSWQGFRSMFVHVVEERLGVVLFTNLNNQTVDVRRIARHVLMLLDSKFLVKSRQNPSFSFVSK